LANNKRFNLKKRYTVEAFLYNFVVPNGFPRCSTSSQCVPQDVPNRTSLCPICFAQAALLKGIYRWAEGLYDGAENIYIVILGCT
jgi:hypothetical protein